MVDSKEIYKFDLGVKGLKCILQKDCDVYRLPYLHKQKLNEKRNQKIKKHSYTIYSRTSHHHHLREKENEKS